MPQYRQHWATHGRHYRNSTAPAQRAGYSWTDPEALDLIDGYLLNGLSFQELAVIHQRGVEGVGYKVTEIMNKPGELERLRAWALRRIDAQPSPPRQQQSLFDVEYVDPKLVDLVFEGGRLVSVKIRGPR